MEILNARGQEILDFIRRTHGPGGVMRSGGEWMVAANAHDWNDLKSGFLSLIQNQVADVWGPDHQPITTLTELDAAFRGDQRIGITVMIK